jgi:ABC-type proline/glycine betaine transport system substrate-binding protein
MRIFLLLAALAIAGGSTSAAAQQHTVRIGMVRALSATPTMIAIEKGYFKQYGINAEVNDVDTTALIPLAQNRRLFQRARKELSDHHRNRPGRLADRP